MEPRVALDKTIKFFKLKASDLAKTSGIDRHEISKYRRGHKDMGSANLFKVVAALPLNAKLYFCHLCIFGEDADFEAQKGLAESVRHDSPESNCESQAEVA